MKRRGRQIGQPPPRPYERVGYWTLASRRKGDDVDRLAQWSFRGAQEIYGVAPKRRVISNDLRSLIGYARRGPGLAHVYADMAAPHLDDGDLIEGLPDHVPPLPRYALNYRSKTHMPRRLRAFLDLAKAMSR